MDYAIGMSRHSHSHPGISNIQLRVSIHFLLSALVNHTWILTQWLSVFVFFWTVSAETLKGSLATMERNIQRLENDITNFPKTDDPQDKFVEKMSISLIGVTVDAHFWWVYVVTCLRGWSTCLSTAEVKVCAISVALGSGKQFKSLGVIGGTQGNLWNGPGCLAVQC